MAMRSISEDLQTLEPYCLALVAAERYSEAERLLREALAANEKQPIVSMRLGMVLGYQGKWKEADRFFRKAIAWDPQYADAHHNLGDALMNLGQYTEARESLEKALSINPRNPDTHNSLGVVLSQLGQHDRSISCYHHALALDTAHAFALVNVGNDYRERGLFALAAHYYESSLASRPNYEVTHCNFGAVLHELGKWDKAIESYECAITLKPDFAEARYNLAVTRLFLQQFEVAWSGYEQRLKRKQTPGLFRKDPATLDRYQELERWRAPGSPTSRVRELAIWAEQGIGDQVLFSTLIPELIKTGVPLVYEIDARLLPAYQRRFAQVRFVPTSDPPREDLQKASHVLLAGSLPGYFRLSRSDFARQPRRLIDALPQRVAHYRKQFDGLGAGPKVALSWRSTRKGSLRHSKSAALADFSPLLRLVEVNFVNVQYGDTEAERRTVEQTTGRRLFHIDDVNIYDDLEELLAILDACDLIITTSNVTAHLAGALGKNTWVLFPKDRPPFHYWSHGGSYRSPWYPSVDVISGVRLENWPSVAEAAAARLKREFGIIDAIPAVQTEGGKTADSELEDAIEWRLEGRFEDAIGACHRALELSRSDGRIWNELAHLLRLHDKADGAYEAAIRAVELTPHMANAWFNLGAALEAKKRSAEAAIMYRKAIELDHCHAEAWSNYGGVLLDQAKWAEAVDAYRRAVAIKPHLAPAWSNLGNALREEGSLEDAVQACTRATALDPGFAAAWSNLANALHDADRYDDAMVACQRALNVEPRLGEAWNIFGSALRSVCRYGEAIAAHEQALGMQPDNAAFRFNFGITLQHCGRADQAIPQLRRALAIEPRNADVHSELGLALLGNGHLAEGWPEYEWRWQRPGARVKRHAGPAWDGDASNQHHLLLWSEQGIGDQILYSSMIPELATTSMRITLEVDGRLVSLLQRSFPMVAVVSCQQPSRFASDAHDCQLPLGSLGRWLRPSLESFPRQEGFLEADAARASASRSRLDALGQGIRVGISWASANREFGDRKTTGLDRWAGILRVPGVQFVDLQYGDTAAVRASLRREYQVNIVHFEDLDLYHDLEGLAALCAACDLVITVSNVTAHVAGALGKPVWLIVPAARGRLWYWFAGRKDSPWYPSMRIYSQHQRGDWQGVFEEVARDLAAWSAERTGRQ